LGVTGDAFGDTQVVNVAGYCLSQTAIAPTVTSVPSVIVADADVEPT
jgi:hypothetical protein